MDSGSIHGNPWTFTEIHGQYNRHRHMEQTGIDIMDMYVEDVEDVEDILGTGTTSFRTLWISEALWKLQFSMSQLHRRHEDNQINLFVKVIIDAQNHGYRRSQAHHTHQGHHTHQLSRQWSLCTICSFYVSGTFLNFFLRFGNFPHAKKISFKFTVVSSLALKIYRY
jgi:hypothetical protein